MPLGSGVDKTKGIYMRLCLAILTIFACTSAATTASAKVKIKKTKKTVYQVQLSSSSVDKIFVVDAGTALFVLGGAYGTKTLFKYGGKISAEDDMGRTVQGYFKSLSKVKFNKKLGRIEIYFVIDEYYGDSPSKSKARVYYDIARKTFTTVCGDGTKMCGIISDKTASDIE